jgi:hypothetical protein
MAMILAGALDVGEGVVDLAPSGVVVDAVTDEPADHGGSPCSWVVATSLR